jgi:hypothetical protein
MIMGRIFNDNLSRLIIDRLYINNSFQFIRIYLCIFAPLFLIALIYCIANGLGTGASLKTILMAGLICLPVSIVTWGTVNKFSGFFTNALLGLGKTEDHSEELSNSEIMQLTSLKERGQYKKLLAKLTDIEEQYGLFSRLIYERALCLIKLGELRRARRCVKDFLNGPRPNEKDEAYYNYCRELLFHENGPLREEIVLKEIKTPEKRP